MAAEAIDAFRCCRFQPLAGLFGHRLEAERRRCGMLGQRPRQRMQRMRCQRRGDRPVAVVGVHGLGQARPPHRQRPGLVEGDAVDFCQPLDRRAVLDHDAVLEQPAGGHDLHHRNGQPQRAGAGDDQHGDGDQHRVLPVSIQKTPAEKAGERQSVDDRRIIAGGAVGDAAVFRPAAFRRLHHADDLRQQRILRRRRRGDHQRTGEVEAARLQFVAGADRQRHAFAGDDRQVDIADAADDFGIDRNALPGGQRDPVADLDLVDRHVTT